MTCDRCGETLPDGIRFCPFCGAEQIVVPVAETEEDPVREEPAAGAETAAPVEIDDGWRPFRYERPARVQRRTTRAQSRSLTVNVPTLRVLAVWLAAVIVIAAGVFWYVWTGNDAPAQPILTATTAYRSEASLAHLAGPAPDFSRFSQL